MNEEFDYRNLLIKYIAHIINMEGYSFIDDIGGTYIEFTEEEKKELEKLCHEPIKE